MWSNIRAVNYYKFMRFYKTVMTQKMIKQTTMNTDKGWFSLLIAWGRYRRK